MMQASERVRNPFALGTQWHPKQILYQKRLWQIFVELLAAARSVARVNQRGGP
jgi:putative glutamine amidotransferase